MSMLDKNPSWVEDVEESQKGRRAEKMKMESRESSSSRKRIKHNLSESDKSDKSDKPSKPPSKPIELETDPSILQRRQKQIDYGKNTVGYHNYLQQVPLHTRTKEHPRTPDKYTKYSRRSWDTLIKMWRIKLHEYDTEANANDEYESDKDSNN